MQTRASELRSVKGMRHLEFIRSKTNPSQYGAIMHFRTIEDLENYKSKESGTYQKLVRSIRETWMDNTKPVEEQVFEILDI
jgi:heme-degrading monooxygenase HmoA